MSSTITYSLFVSINRNQIDGYDDIIDAFKTSNDNRKSNIEEKGDQNGNATKMRDEEGATDKKKRSICQKIKNQVWHINFGKH